jgi:hypothetical protein
MTSDQRQTLEQIAHDQRVTVGEVVRGLIAQATLHSPRVHLNTSTAASGNKGHAPRDRLPTRHDNGTRGRRAREHDGRRYRTVHTGSPRLRVGVWRRCTHYAESQR